MPRGFPQFNAFGYTSYFLYYIKKTEHATIKALICVIKSIKLCNKKH